MGVVRTVAPVVLLLLWGAAAWAQAPTPTPTLLPADTCCNYGGGICSGPIEGVNCDGGTIVLHASCPYPVLFTGCQPFTPTPTQTQTQTNSPTATNTPAAPAIPANTWTRLNPAQETISRTYGGGTWDSADNVMLVFGGGDGGYWGNQVSRYDPVANTWRDDYTPELSTTYEGAYPGAVCSTDADCPGNLTAPFHSCAGHCRSCDVGSPATQYNAITPLGRPWTAHVNDSILFENGKLWVHGGIAGKRCLHEIHTTWEYDPSAKTWSNLWPNGAQTGDPPYAGIDGAFAYDSDRNLAIQFSGTSADNSTTIYNLVTHQWTNIRPAGSPAARAGTSGLYDPVDHKVLIFGGWNGGGQNLAELWEFDTGSNTWANRNAANPPPARGGAGFVWDSAAGVAFMWGGIGFGQNPKWNDTWIYDYASNTWTDLNATGPAAFAPRGQMQYDPAHDRVILAYNGSSSFDDDNAPTSGQRTTTWAFQYVPADAPTPTITLTPTAGDTPTSTATPTVTATATATFTTTTTPTITLTPTPTTGNSPTPTATQGPCTWHVGPGRTYTKPGMVAALVANGDTVCIDPVDYVGDTAIWNKNNLTLRGVGGRARLNAGGAVAGGKAIWDITGNNITVQNIEFACASSRGVCVGGPQAGAWCISEDMCWQGADHSGSCAASSPECGNNAELIGVPGVAGIRIDGTAHDLTVDNCYFHDNDNGILGGNKLCSLSGTVCTVNSPCGGGQGSCLPVGTVTVTNSEFFRNGDGDSQGQTHGAYITTSTLVFQGNYAHQARVGHELKTTAATNYILYNRIMSEATGTSSVLVEIPYGGLSYVIGNVMEKGPLASAYEFVKYAAEINRGNAYYVNPVQELYVVNNTMVSNYGRNVAYTRLAGQPLVWFKDNIAAENGELVSWKDAPPGTSVVAANITALNALFANGGVNYDYHLADNSPAINVGVAPGTAQGFDLTPVRQYVYDTATVPRQVNGALDIGAFEAGVPVPTPTNTPTFTPLVYPAHLIGTPVP